MNKLYRRKVLVLLLLTLLVTSVLTQVEGQRRRRSRSLSVAAASAQPQQQKFQLTCTQPALGNTALNIDKICGINGKSSPSSASGKQNEIKNRFCLPGSPTTAIDIDFATFDALQREAQKRHIPFGRRRASGRQDCKQSIETMPSDRSVLVKMIKDAQGRDIGEGTLVRLEAFVFSANHSNTFVNGFDGESVNCKQTSLEGNDIHIALVETANVTNKCESVTAEISPHFRSTIYNRFDTDRSDFLNGKPQKPGEDKLEGSPMPLKGARVRITGQLFFDASHAPCGKRCGNSPRRSIWEIHPVYLIEVFDTAKNKFVTLDEWVQNH